MVYVSIRNNVFSRPLGWYIYHPSGREMPKTANLSLIKAHFAKVRQSTFTPTQLNTLVGSGNSEPLIPEILTRSVCGSKVSSRLR